MIHVKEGHDINYESNDSKNNNNFKMNLQILQESFFDVY